ncbi:MAG: hypothetical protein M1365_08940 [Actinobacteria bacterium]|nr:hypothetical protein [Actinomycetota bacterium]
MAEHLKKGFIPVELVSRQSGGAPLDYKETRRLVVIPGYVDTRPHTPEHQFVQKQGDAGITRRPHANFVGTDRRIPLRYRTFRESSEKAAMNDGFDDSYVNPVLGTSDFLAEADRVVYADDEGQQPFSSDRLKVLSGLRKEHKKETPTQLPYAHVVQDHEAVALAMVLNELGLPFNIAASPGESIPGNGYRVPTHSVMLEYSVGPYELSDIYDAAKDLTY